MGPGGEGAFFTEREDRERKKEGEREQHLLFTQEKHIPKTIDWEIKRN